MASRRPGQLYVQSSTIGVSPDRIVLSSAATSDQDALLLEVGEVLDAGHDVVERAAVGERCRHTPANAAPASRGSPLSDTWPAYCGSLRSANDVGTFSTSVVLVADRHDPVVGGDPVAVRVLQRVGDLVPHRRHVRVPDALLDRLQGERRADVDRVGHRVRAALRLDGGELVGRRGVRVLHRVVDARVLVAERLQDAAVVRPVVGQGDEVDLSLLEGRLVERLQVGGRLAAARVSAGAVDPSAGVVESGGVVADAVDARATRRVAVTPNAPVRGDVHGCCELSWTERSPRQRPRSPRGRRGRGHSVNGERRAGEQSAIRAAASCRTLTAPSVAGTTSWNDGRPLVVFRCSQLESMGPHRLVA